MSDEQFVEEAYRLFLRRAPDEDGLRSALSRLEHGEVSRATLLAELASSAEFERLRALDDAAAFASWARSANQRPRGLTAPGSVDERAIEIPWVLSRYRGESHVLDVGYANAEPEYLRALVAACPQEPVGVDLVDALLEGIRGVRGDLRGLPFDDGSFDVVFCISTLEHVGADNRVYGVEDETAGGMAEALLELRRVLRANGRLLLSVPCGHDEHHGWFVQHEPERWRELFEEAGFLVYEDEVYEHGPSGWHSGDGRDARYGDHAGAVLCAELRPAHLTTKLRLRLARRSHPE